MERLTKRINGVEVYVGAKNSYSTGQIPCEVEPAGVREMMDRLAAYEDTGLTPEEINDLASVREIPPEAEYAINKHADSIIERLDKLLAQTDDDVRLRELAEADRSGRVEVLPCKVGDTVWANLDGMRHPRKCVIEFVNIGSHVTTIVFSTVDGLREQYGVNPSSFGKTVFLTREGAEKALEAMEGK